MKGLKQRLCLGALDPPLSGPLWKLSPSAQGSRAPLGLHAGGNWLSAPQITKTHWRPGRGIKEGPDPVCCRSAVEGQGGQGSGGVPPPLQPQLAQSAARPHPRTPAAPKTTSREFASKFCPCTTTAQRKPPPPTFWLERVLPQHRLPVLPFCPSPQQHGTQQARRGLAFPDAGADVEPSSEARQPWALPIGTCGVTRVTSTFSSNDDNYGVNQTTAKC